jgi:predicted transcriptional regulator
MTESMMKLTTDVVAAFVSNNLIPLGQLSDLIKDVHSVLEGVNEAPVHLLVEEPVPAVNPKKSVQEDYIICLEDGRKFRSLKRHLRVKFQMSPETSVNMNDCINRPDRRLHLTQSSKTSNHPLHRGSHPQKTSPATKG